MNLKTLACTHIFDSQLHPRNGKEQPDVYIVLSERLTEGLSVGLDELPTESI